MGKNASTASQLQEQQMPFVRISTGGAPLAHSQVQALQRKSVDLLSEILGKRKEVTVVAVDTLSADRWASGASPLEEGAHAAQVDVTITAGTNSGEERSRFISAMHGMIRDVLGPSPVPLYVMVHQLDADQWGFDGRTQADRRSRIS
jgi:4-oxalocrotonate tautomerase